MSTPVVVIDTVPLALSSVAFNTAPQLKAPVSIAAIVGNDELTVKADDVTSAAALPAASLTFAALCKTDHLLRLEAPQLK